MKKLFTAIGAVATIGAGVAGGLYLYKKMSGRDLDEDFDDDYDDDFSDDEDEEVGYVDITSEDVAKAADEVVDAVSEAIEDVKDAVEDAE